jgi:hypothetical protein
MEKQTHHNVHSQFAFSGDISFKMSMLRLPWDVCRMTSGSTPSSLPMLRVLCQGMQSVGEFEISRMPVLDYCICRVYYGAVHIK